MPTTTNKGYEVQVTGSNTGTWGATLNTQALEYIDLNLGGITSKTLSNVNVTLSASESRSAILRLSGVLTGAVVITTSCIGFFFVENLTSGSYVVTVKNDQVATAATIPQGSRQTVVSDATNGCRTMSSGFETGVKTVFYMSTAPIGWTRDATAALNEAGIRLMTTGGAATGGSVEFTTAFSATRITLAQANLPSVSLTADSNGAHTHFIAQAGTGPTGAYLSSTDYMAYARGGSEQAYVLAPLSTGATVGLTSSNGAHTHTVPLGGSATPISLAVKYADFMIAAKD